MHVITTGDDGNLYDCTSTDNTHWSFNRITNTWLFTGVNPAATIYSGRLHVFVAGFNAHLYDVYTDDGHNWTMDDHGAPGLPGGGTADIRNDAAAISYWYGNTHMLHVFIEGRVGTVVHVYDHWWDGHWHWDDRASYWGQLGGAPAAIDYWAGNVHQVHAYLTDASGNLFDLYSNDNGNSWNFDNHGNGGTALYGSPGVAVYTNWTDSIYNQLHVLTASVDGHVWDHWWDGNWHWNDRGNPGGYRSFASPAVTTYWDGYETQLHAYVAGGQNGDIYDVYTNDGITWYCDDHGRPSGTYMWRAPAVAVDTAGRLDVFAHGSNGSLYEHWWDGDWHWTNLSRPNGAYIVQRGGQSVDAAPMPGSQQGASPAMPPSAMQPSARDRVFSATASPLGSLPTRWALLQAETARLDWNSIDEPLTAAL
jgi:hypothetical protein